MFSGEGLFVYKISGQGILWVTSFGAIIRKDVSAAAKGKGWAKKDVANVRAVAKGRKVLHR